MVHALLIALIVLAAVPAHATIFHALTFDSCRDQPSTDMFLFDPTNTLGAGDTITASTVTDVQAGNQCSLLWNASASAQWRGLPIPTPLPTPAVLNATLHAIGKTAPTTCQTVAQVTNASGVVGCFVEACPGNGENEINYQVHYNVDTNKFCSGAQSPHNDTLCTTDADCPETNPGEAQCDARILGSASFDVTDPFLLTLRQVNGTGTVNCSLRAGPAGNAPAAGKRGSATLTVGQCSGGTNTYACVQDSECDGIDTCVLTHPIAPEQFRIGVLDGDTGGSDLQYYLDSLLVYDGDAEPNWRAISLLPNGAGTEISGNWSPLVSSTNWEAVADGQTPSLDERARAPGSCGPCTTADDAEDLAIAPPPTPLPTPVLVHAVIAEVLARDKESADSDAITLDLEFAEGGPTPAPTTAAYTAFYLDAFSDDGAAAAHFNMPVLLSEVRPGDGAAWTTADLENVELRMEQTAADHTGDDGSVSAVAVSYFADVADPVVTVTVGDYGLCGGGDNDGTRCEADSDCTGAGTCDNDGEVTGCLGGDSRNDNATFHDAFVEQSPQFDNIQVCTKGGVGLGDLELDIADMLDGRATQFMACRSRFGGSGKRCDVVFIDIGANSFNGGVPLRTTDATLYGGIGQDGFCEDDGGSEQGDPCQCPNGQSGNWTHFSRPDSPGNQWCTVKGADWKNNCTTDTCTCSVDADCTYAGVAGTCGVTTPTKCDVSFLDGDGSSQKANSPGNDRQAWCVQGCDDSPQCPNGICSRNHTMSRIFQATRAIQAVIDGHSAKPVWVIPAAGPEVGSQASVAGWKFIHPQNNQYGTWLRKWAQSKSLNYVDVAAVMKHTLPNPNAKCATPNACTAAELTAKVALRDEIHPSAYQQEQWAIEYGRCGNNTDGTSDGTCDTVTTNLCTAGLINKPCTSDDNCHTYECVF